MEAAGDRKARVVHLTHNDLDAVGADAVHRRRYGDIFTVFSSVGKFPAFLSRIAALPGRNHLLSITDLGYQDRVLPALEDARRNGWRIEWRDHHRWDERGVRCGPRAGRPPSGRHDPMRLRDRRGRPPARRPRRARDRDRGLRLRPLAPPRPPVGRARPGAPAPAEPEPCPRPPGPGPVHRRPGPGRVRGDPERDGRDDRALGLPRPPRGHALSDRVRAAVRLPLRDCGRHPRAARDRD